MPDSAAVEDMRKKRFQFLLRLYEVTGGNELAIASMFDVGEELGLDHDQTSSVYQYLRSEGLLRARGIGGLIGLTHEGVVEIESAISKPQQPTEHFPALNIVVVGQMIGSQVQQAVGQADQVAVIGKERLNELKEILARLEASVAELDLERNQVSDLIAEIRTVKAQLETSKPSRSVILECLSSIRKILEGAIGSALGQVLLGKILAWLLATG